MGFLKKPGLPDSKIKLCAIAAGCNGIKSALEARGITVLETEPHSDLAAPIAAHADMQLHDMGGGRAVAAKGAGKIIEKLKSFGFSVEEQDIATNYPKDAALNCFLLGNNFFYNKNCTSKVLLNYYQSIGAGAINVNQGYTKCSTCIVDANAIITADASIASAAEALNVKVLKIQSGEISLYGYDTGFIGGCSGLISDTELAFTGKLSSHPDGHMIADFCESLGVGVVELTNSGLIDIGGILPLAIY